MCNGFLHVSNGFLESVDTIRLLLEIVCPYCGTIITGIRTVTKGATVDVSVVTVAVSESAVVRNSVISFCKSGITASERLAMAAA